MRIAVAGASGTAGRAVCDAAEAAGHDVVRLSRSGGVDLVAGTGLEPGSGVLEGCGAVVDASAVAPPEGQLSWGQAHRRAAENLAAACLRAQVPRLVVLSIVGIHDPGVDGFPYYVAKREQERAVRDSGQAATVVSSAQWFEFATNPAAVTVRDDEVRVQDWMIQPVALGSVAELLVELAARPDAPRSVAVAGPQPMRLGDLTARYLDAVGDGRPVVTVPPEVPALAEGILLAPEGAEVRGPELAQWLRDPPRLPLG